ncbi:hypothetical protein AFLA_001746 [Aspergillus flavus NRRL3357]|nr:hypothetical protein AFLA_001746 [Aspergillus flavus NRRL3357]
MSDNSFHYFTRLPLELRRLIWEHCLPYRIAELDIPAFLLDGEESRQACLPEYTTHQNAQLPVIAFVNSESRQVALEEGRWVQGQETTSKQLIWVQPRRDVLHLNWTRMSYDVLGPLGARIGKGPAVQALFELLTNARFRAAVGTWKSKAEWIILASMWDYARRKNGILGTNPGSAWVPYLPEEARPRIDLSQYSPNENHPWVKEARQSMPKLRPWIMVRHCANECYKKPPPKSYW